MNKKDAKKIAETISNEEIKKMFDKAKSNIKDWTKVSKVNKGMTIGVSWNILAKDFNINHKYHVLAKTNMIREFGDYLSKDVKSNKEKKTKVNNKVFHQNLEFLNGKKN